MDPQASEDFVESKTTAKLSTVLVTVGLALRTRRRKEVRKGVEKTQGQEAHIEASRRL
jgi:hypothetical protein